MESYRDVNILVVEDDAHINSLIYKILIGKGFNVRQAFSGSEGKMCLDMFEFHMVILDLMLPGISGEELIEDIRKNKNMPIIVISAKTSKESKIGLLKLGADDFVCKPFDIDEVEARVEAHIRRYMQFSKESSKEDAVLKHKNLELNKDEIKIEVKGIELTVTAKEFAILELLLSNPKKVFSRSNLFKSVWKDDFLGDDNTINVHMSNLRAKIGELDKENDYIKTVWGVGFKLSE